MKFDFTVPSCKSCVSGNISQGLNLKLDGTQKQGEHVSDALERVAEPSMGGCRVLPCGRIQESIQTLSGKSIQVTVPRPLQMSECAQASPGEHTPAPQSLSD